MTWTARLFWLALLALLLLGSKKILVVARLFSESGTGDSAQIKDKCEKKLLDISPGESQRDLRPLCAKVTT